MSDFNFSFGFTTDLTGLKSLEKEFDTISRKIDRIKDLKLNPNVNTSQLERLDRVQTALFGRLDLIQRAYVELDSAMNQAGSEGKALERVFVRLTEAAARESRVLGDLTGHFRNVDVAMEAMINPQLNSFLGNLELALNRVSLAVENHSDALREENALTQRNIDLKQAQMRATQASIEARRAATKQTNAELETAGLLGLGGDSGELLDRLSGTVKQALISTPIYAAAYAATANIQSSIQDFVQFDTVLNRIAIVTGETTDSVRELKVAFMESAKALSVSGVEYAKGTQTFLAQGGAAAKFAEDLTKASVQLANVTGTSTQDTSDYLTAIGNSFKLIEQGPESIQKMADVLLYLDNASATSADEIGQAMRRAASSFESAGISYEKASAMIATSSEITRQAPERIGTAFKTMIETIQEVRKQGPDSVKEFSSKIQETIDQFPSLKGKLTLFDETGTQMVDTTEFLNQLQNTFQEIKTTDPLAAKAVMQAIGGKENANILAALLESGDRYEELYKGIITKALGSADKAQEEYANSLEAQITKLKGAWEEFINELISNQAFSNILTAIQRMVEGIHFLLGDSNQLLKIFGALAVLKFAPAAVGRLFTVEGGTTLVSIIKNNIFDPKTKALFPKKEKEIDNPDEMDRGEGKGKIKVPKFLTSLTPIREEIKSAESEINNTKKEIEIVREKRRAVNDQITALTQEDVKLLDKVKQDFDSRISDKLKGVLSIPAKYRTKREQKTVDRYLEAVKNEVTKIKEANGLMEKSKRLYQQFDDLNNELDLLGYESSDPDIARRSNKPSGKLQRQEAKKEGLEDLAKSRSLGVKGIRGLLGGGAAALVGLAIEAISSALTDPRGISSMFENWMENIGANLGSMLLGALGMVFAGPAGAIVGANLGSWIGEWIQKAVTPDKAAEENKKYVDQNVKKLAELEEKKRKGIQLTKEERDAYNNLTYELSGYSDQVQKVKNELKAMSDAQEAVVNSSTAYFDAIISGMDGTAESLDNLIKKYGSYADAVQKVNVLEQAKAIEEFSNKYIKDEGERLNIAADINNAMISDNPAQAMLDIVAGNYSIAKAAEEDSSGAIKTAKEKLYSDVFMRRISPSEKYQKSALTAESIKEGINKNPLSETIDALGELGKEYNFSVNTEKLKGEKDTEKVRKTIETILNVIISAKDAKKKADLFNITKTEESAKAFNEEATKVAGMLPKTSATDVGFATSKKQTETKLIGLREQEKQRQKKSAENFKAQFPGIEDFQKTFEQQIVIYENTQNTEDKLSQINQLVLDVEQSIRLTAAQAGKPVKAMSEAEKEAMSNRMKFLFDDYIKAKLAAETYDQKLENATPELVQFNPKAQRPGPFINVPGYNDKSNIAVGIEDLLAQIGTPLEVPEPVKESFNRPAELLELSQIDVAAEQNRIVKLINDKIQNIKDGNGTAEEKLKELEKLYSRRLKLLKSAKDSYKNALNISKKNLQDIVNQDKGILKGISLKEAGDGFFDENSIQRIRQRLELNVRSSQSGLAGLGEKTDQNNNSFVRAEKAVYNAEQALEKFNRAHSAYQTSVEKSNEANEALTDTLREQKKEIVSMQQEILEIDLTEAFFGKNKSLDKIEQYFNLITAQQNKYASALEKQLHLSKLQAQLDKDKLKYGTNPQLLAFQAKLNKAKDDGRKYSEEELKIIDSEYQVYLKQVMLKRAEQQANAGTVLMRDAAGNWIYGAKPGEKGKEDVLDANEDLTDAIDDLNRQLEAAITNTNKSLLDTTKQLIGIEKEIALNTTIANDKTGTYSDKEQKAAQERLKQLEGIQQALRGQLMIDQDSLKNLADKASVTAALGAAQATGAAATRDAILKESDLEAAKKIATNLSESSQALITSQLAPVKDQVATLGTTLTNLDGALKVVSEKLAGKDGLKTDFENISDVSEKVIAALGKEGKESTGLVGAINSVDSIIDETTATIKEKLTKFDEDARKTIKSINDAGKLFETSIKTAGDDAVKKIDAAAKKIDTAVGKINAENAKPAPQPVVITQGLSQEEVSKLAKKLSLETQKAQKIAEKDSAQDVLSSANANLKVATPGTSAYSSQTSIANAANQRIKDLTSDISAIDKELKKYDTGGYTGDFSGGKIAMLHEKELVLNKEDTKNILNSVKIIREVASSVNPKEIFSSIPSSEVSNSTIINASFPNVSSSEEIRKAFANMSNNASQFAYRMRPAY